MTTGSISRGLGRSALCAALLVALGGCSADYAKLEQHKELVESTKVYPPKYKEDILALMRTYLNDPTEVRDAKISGPELKHVGSGERYVVCIRYNARNSEGRYVGPRDNAVIFFSGRLDHINPGRALCKEAAYQPFPELERLTR